MHWALKQNKYSLNYMTCAKDFNIASLFAAMFYPYLGIIKIVEFKKLGILLIYSR